MTLPRFRSGLLIVMGLIMTLTLVGCDAAESRTSAIIFINNERTSRGLPGISWADDLAQKAQAWADHLAAVGQLGHSVLTDGVAPGWTVIGENVGVGGDIAAVHEGFMNSPRHRDAILNGQYRSVGVGATQRGNELWVVEVFSG